VAAPVSSLTALQAAYQNACNLLQEITLKPKPSYSVDGESWSWNEYQSMLTQQIKSLKQLIQDESGPFIVSTRGIT
jgi:hypothetical protein